MLFPPKHRVHEKEPKYYANGEDAYEMRKALGGGAKATASSKPAAGGEAASSSGGGGAAGGTGGPGGKVPLKARARATNGASAGSDITGGPDDKEHQTVSDAADPAPADGTDLMAYDEQR